MGYVTWSENMVQRFLKEGRGEGTGQTYKPWLRIGEVRTSGRTHDPTSDLCQRPHHLLSDQEYHFFLMLEFNSTVRDIREQFPLKRELTQEVAHQLGIVHPCYWGTHVPTVMTADFLVTYERNGKEELEAFNVKPRSTVEDYKELEKLELQRETLARMSIPHHLILHHLLPEKQATSNLKWFRGGKLRPGEVEPHPGFFGEHAMAMANDLASTSFTGTLTEYCHHYASNAGIARAAGMRVARLLLWRRIIEVDDLTQQGIEHLPLNRFRINSLRANGAF